MEIDWFTIGAQILNFLVLVWLLKRFLYQPVLNAIDQRESRIAAALGDAAASKAEAAKERDALQAKIDAFDKQRADLMAQAVVDAEASRKKLSAEARAEIEALKQQQHKALSRDAANLSAEIARRAQGEVFAITRKALADMADETLEKRLASLFVRKLQALEGDDKSAVARILASTQHPPVIRSAFVLSAAQRATITRAIEAAFKTKVQPGFETAPELVSGIELVGGGQKLAWSLGDYLKTLEKSVSELVSTRVSGAGESA